MSGKGGQLDRLHLLECPLDLGCPIHTRLLLLLEAFEMDLDLQICGEAFAFVMPRVLMYLGLSMVTV